MVRGWKRGVVLLGCMAGLQSARAQQFVVPQTLAVSNRDRISPASTSSAKRARWWPGCEGCFRHLVQPCRPRAVRPDQLQRQLCRVPAHHARERQRPGRVHADFQLPAHPQRSGRGLRRGGPRVARDAPRTGNLQPGQLGLLGASREQPQPGHPRELRDEVHVSLDRLQRRSRVGARSPLPLRRCGALRLHRDR